MMPDQRWIDTRAIYRTHFVFMVAYYNVITKYDDGTNSGMVYPVVGMLKFMAKEKLGLLRIVNE